MKNLLEKMKPEIILAINQDYLQYPSLKEEIFNELNSKKFVTNLEYRYIIDLERFYKIAFGNFPTKVWDCLTEI